MAHPSHSGRTGKFLVVSDSCSFVSSVNTRMGNGHLVCWNVLAEPCSSQQLHAAAAAASCQENWITHGTSQRIKQQQLWSQGVRAVVDHVEQCSGSGSGSAPSRVLFRVDRRESMISRLFVMHAMILVPAVRRRHRSIPLICPHVFQSIIRAAKTFVQFKSIEQQQLITSGESTSRKGLLLGRGQLCSVFSPSSQHKSWLAGGSGDKQQGQGQGQVRCVSSLLKFEKCSFQVKFFLP